MKISTRTQAILAATVFFFVIILFVIANAFIQSSFTRIELQQSAANINLVSGEIQSDIEQLGTKARDWAVWDDTYQFMEDKNDHYYQTIINTPATYESLQISGLVYFDADGNVVASQGYNAKNKSLTPLSEATIATLSRKVGSLSNTRGGKKKQGIIELPDGPALVGMHAILQTNGLGFGRGTLIMLQPFDEGRISSIRERINLPVMIWHLNTPSPVVTPDIAELTGENAPASLSRIQDASTLLGLTLVRDIDNQPVLLIGVETPRVVSQQMTGTLVYLVAAFFIIGACYVIITGMLMRRYIITPLTDLDAAMKSIGRKGDLSQRLPAGDSDDEISSLKESFNTMLAELQEKETELTRQGELLAEAHRKANMYLDIYLDVLTYEILNVTISLQAYAELIRESGDATNKDYADRITAALNRNLSVIRNIETISKIYKTPPGTSTVRLKDIVEKEVGRFPGKDIRYSGGDVSIIADEMLGIVFHNIFTNSLQFTRDDLFVEVAARDAGNGMIEISVMDNGSGIPDDMKPLIFDRFMKGSDKRSSYGLGLHIVKMLIEAYGGRVWADDRVAGQPGMGAAIRFTLRKA
ncbi:MAG: HAMP domain-containing protein [Methanomicrobiales archaeon]|nr:HAMP domain-containing protein [Methanomicrobiales archaeon]